jgi:hypothetical protein
MLAGAIKTGRLLTGAVVGETAMRRLLGVLFTAVILAAGFGASARADEGRVALTIYKGGWVIGGSGGSGVLVFHGRRYPLSIGGLSYGLVFGGSKAELSGVVSNIRSPRDVAGVYGAVGAGAAVGVGARATVLSNEKGAVLHLSGRQVGLIADLDLSGMAIGLR